LINLQDILAARERIRGHVAVTPCPFSRPFSDLCGAQIHFKLENLQRTGSFKERGAANKLALLTREERARGIVAASPGNHAPGWGPPDWRYSSRSPTSMWWSDRSAAAAGWAGSPSR